MMYRLEVVVALIGAAGVGFYACVLMDKHVRLKRHKMYMDTFVKSLEVCCLYTSERHRRLVSSVNSVERVRTR